MMSCTGAGAATSSWAWLGRRNPISERLLWPACLGCDNHGPRDDDLFFPAAYQRRTDKTIKGNTRLAGQPANAYTTC